MPNLDALDTAIAVVIVLLLLSLIVQSVQGLLKKLFKIKSRQLEQSLVDLFRQVLASPSQEATESAADRATERLRKSPMLQLLIPRAKHPSEQAGGDVKTLYQAVMVKFREIGRVSQAGNHMLDSISKEDLIKILRSVAPSVLLPNLVADLRGACQQINALNDALAAIDISHLDGEASAKFAAMHEALAPVLSDMQCIMANKELKPELLLGDVMNLRQIKLDDVLKLLGEVQKKVEADIASAPNNPTRLTNLTKVATGLRTIAGAIIKVRQKFDSALAPLRSKLNEVEVWYDTVMQSFEERYSRGMKTWAVVISFIVVVFLNANFFNIYRNISTNDVTRNLIMQAGPNLLARSKEATGGKPPPSPTSGQGERSAPGSTGAQSESPAASGTASLRQSPSSSPSPAPGSLTLTTTTMTTPPTAVTTTTTTQESGSQSPQELLTELKQVREQLKNDVDAYSGFGFTPLRWAQVRYWFSTWARPYERDASGNIVLNNEGNPIKRTDLWLNSRKHDLIGLLGWIITALLLSVGAPFWQDTLESLFGVKSLLRKRGDIKNVEAESGAGQPKT
jgi:hypothetical protein